MIFDSESKRFYIKTKPTNKTKIYINDARAKSSFKVSTQYLKVLNDVLKKDKNKIFGYLNEELVNDPAVVQLLRKYRVIETEKFKELYKASVNFIKSWKENMVFTIGDVKKGFKSVSV